MAAVRPDTYRAAFALGEYRALFAAHAVSVTGDQFARVALSILVFQRTGSPAWTAIAYGLTFLPGLAGGPLLSGLADRYPRRTVMISADLLRAAAVALMAVQAMPLAAVCALLVLAELAGAPGGAARAALLPRILPGELYPVGQAGLGTVGQAAQVVGFAGGGALVGWFGPHAVLLADAGTFAVSALLVWRWVHPHAAVGGAQRRWWRDLTTGACLVWTDRRLRSLVALACVSGTYIAGEALAAPYAEELGGRSVVVGLLFAGFAAGASVGMLALARFPQHTRLRLMGPLAVAACAPLVVCAANPGTAVTVALFVLSGIGSGYQVVASTAFMRAVPDEHRGQAFGLAVTAMKVSQGLGVAAAGLAAEFAAPHLVVAAAGVIGVLAAATAWRSWTTHAARTWG